MWVSDCWPVRVTGSQGTLKTATAARGTGANCYDEAGILRELNHAVVHAHAGPQAAVLTRRNLKEAMDGYGNA